jgi:N-methylhydantoinase A
LLAREVGIRTVIVPPSPGTLCALGCLLADLRADFVRTVYTIVDDGGVTELARHLADLEEQAAVWLDREHVDQASRQLERSADMRYRGQSFEVTVEFPQGGTTGLRELPGLFGARHHAVYGFADDSAAVELINLRVQAVGSVTKPAQLAPREASQTAARTVAAPGRRSVLIDGVRREAAVYRRDELSAGNVLEGPAIVVQYDTTVFVPPGFRLSVDPWRNLIGEQVSE